MKIKIRLLGILCLLFSFNLYLGAQQITSPNGNLILNVNSENGSVLYELSYKGKKVILPSKLGVEADGFSMNGDFSIKGVSNKSVDETWKPVWGQYSVIRNNYNEIAVELIQSGSNAREMIVRFRLFNDGLGFRYEFPEQKNLNYFTLLNEITEFRLSGDHGRAAVSALFPAVTGVEHETAFGFLGLMAVAFKAAVL